MLLKFSIFCHTLHTQRALWLVDNKKHSFLFQSYFEKVFHWEKPSQLLLCWFSKKSIQKFIERPILSFENNSEGKTAIGNYKCLIQISCRCFLAENLEIPEPVTDFFGLSFFICKFLMPMSYFHHSKGVEQLEPLSTTRCEESLTTTKEGKKVW